MFHNSARYALEKYHRRALSDCPWLWAVRNSWRPGSPSRELTFVKEDQKHKIYNWLTGSPHAFTEMWMVCQCDNITKVVPVPAARIDDTSYCWLNAINEAFTPGDIVIALVFIWGAITGDHKEVMYIHQAPKNNPLFIHECVFSYCHVRKDV